jgi:ubiquinone/menaquinone biosynthesis C-methylase UbiE
MRYDQSDVWAKKHALYSKAYWVNKPNIFAEEVLEYLPQKSRVLDLGSGQGQDSRFFAELNHDVVSLDVSDKALEESRKKLPPDLSERIKLIEADITEPLPFDDGSFDLVYSHLSLHYFDSETTDNILKEIQRVLSTGGVLAFICNSITDPEYGTGKKLEDDYFFIENKPKRFFSVESVRSFANMYFYEILADNNGETYKDSQHGIHNLIRYVGKKS